MRRKWKELERESEGHLECIKILCIILACCFDFFGDKNTRIFGMAVEKPLTKAWRLSPGGSASKVDPLDPFSRNGSKRSNWM